MAMKKELDVHGVRVVSRVKTFSLLQRYGLVIQEKGKLQQV